MASAWVADNNLNKQERVSRNVCWPAILDNLKPATNFTNSNFANASNIWKTEFDVLKAEPGKSTKLLRLKPTLINGIFYRVTS